jgi:hypothetical protein
MSKPKTENRTGRPYLSVHSQAQSEVVAFPFCVLDQQWVIAVTNTPGKRSTFDEVDHPRGPPETHLHGIFMEPRPSGMGWRRRLRKRPARPTGRVGPVVRRTARTLNVS